MSTMTVSAASSSVDLPDEWQEAFNGLMQALCDRRRSAMVVCPDPDELDQLSREISRTLKRVPQVRMELVRPIGAESLINRFNEMVAALPLDVARREGLPGHPLTLWVMNLSRRLELPEVKLLLNLVQSFPGTGVRLLLLCSRDAASDQAASVASRWGSRLHRWFVQSPRQVATEPPARRAALAAPLATAQLATAPRALLWSGVPVLGRLSARLHRLWHSARRVGVAALGVELRRLHRDHPPLRLPFKAKVPRSRWVWGAGGLVMSLGATAAAWWHIRLDLTHGATTPLRRPVPEIVERVEDARPQALRQEQRS